MPEYAALRFLAALLTFALAIRIIRFRLGALSMFAAYLYAESVSLAIPAQISDPEWWRWVWAPVAAIRLCLLVAAALEVFAFLRPHTHREERSALLAASLAAGMACLFAGWYWHPTNGFQRFTIARQCVLLVVAVATSVAWWYVRRCRPVPISNLLRDHGALWCCWCWVVFAASTTAKGALLWRIVDWEGGEWWWKVVSCGALLAQGGLIGGYWVSLPDLRMRSTDSIAGRSLRGYRA